MSTPPAHSHFKSAKAAASSFITRFSCQVFSQVKVTPGLQISVVDVDGVVIRVFADAPTGLADGVPDGQHVTCCSAIFLFIFLVNSDFQNESEEKQKRMLGRWQQKEYKFSQVDCLLIGMNDPKRTMELLAGARVIRQGTEKSTRKGVPKQLASRLFRANMLHCYRALLQLSLTSSTTTPNIGICKGIDFYHQWKQNVCWTRQLQQDQENSYRTRQPLCGVDTERQ
jgi:hypothetical protein